MLILSTLYFIFALLVRDMNTVFENQTSSSPKKKKDKKHRVYSLDSNERKSVITRFRS